MSEATTVNQVEQFPQPPRDNSVAEDLSKLLDLIKQEFPKALNILFEFDGRLKLHIDVRTGEEVSATEERLPQLCAGTFSQVHHGATPHHPFFHRVTAFVDR